MLKKGSVKEVWISKLGFVCFKAIMAKGLRSSLGTVDIPVLNVQLVIYAHK